MKLETDIEITLPGLADLEPNELFSVEIGNIPNEYSNNINKWLVLTPTKNNLLNSQESLKYNVKFTPMKPFKAIVDMLVFKANGGRWKFKINLESFEPEEDDVIVIESPLNKTTSVTFKLTNK